MRYIKPLSFLAIAAVSSACDPMYGVYRSAHVAFMPEPAAIGNVIRNAPNVTSVKYTMSTSGRRLTLTGSKPPDQMYTFRYQGSDDIHGVVEFTEDYKHRVQYSQSLMSMGIRPPQECIDATRPVMLAIEKGLEDNCGLTNLQSEVREWCHGVKCDGPATKLTK